MGDDRFETVFVIIWYLNLLVGVSCNATDSNIYRPSVLDVRHPARLRGGNFRVGLKCF